MMRSRSLSRFCTFVVSSLTLFGTGVAIAQTPAAGSKLPLKVFILAGDENVLEQAPIEGRTVAPHEDFFPDPTASPNEQKKHVNVFIYEGEWSRDADYRKIKPIATGLVELGEERTKQAVAGKRGRVAVPITPFPELASKPGHTTVVRGYISVTRSGKYELTPGEGDGAFNITTLEGRQVYRRTTDDEKPSILAVQLEPGKRYALETVFVKSPSHAFVVTLTNLPGALTTVVDTNAQYARLRDDAGNWVKRDDVILYDAHPIHNNTKALGHPLQVGDVSYGGEAVRNAIGPDLMLGHVLGEHYDEQILLIRFATRHPIWFNQGSRSLGHDYLPPSSGGTPDIEGNWDVIHFNHGVWDATYREANSKYFSGHHTTSIEDYEKNLRTLVARMKKTGATIIFANTTPVWKGDTPEKPNADVTAYNEVAAKVMRENGVILNDLHAEVLRQGLPKGTNVHEVGNLAPKVTKTILDALAARKTTTKPLPRVLMIGDSITGTYVGRVTADLDGKAFVCKNPGNGEDTWNALEKIDSWLDLRHYLLNGQEYLELVSNVKEAMAGLDRVVPGYQGQKAELAGLIWFQGIRDSQFDSMTAEYEKNLANLITDLRRDLNAPALPVVVVSLPSSLQAVGARAAKIREAQLAMCDPKRYPAFAGNVACVDTNPILPAPEQSSGGRGAHFFGNARAFLEIGNAMAQRMIELRKQLDTATAE